MAQDDAALKALRAAAVAAEWELTPGATNASDALALVGSERPHVVVLFGEFDDVIAAVAERFPGTRIVADHEADSVAVAVGSLDEVRDAVKASFLWAGPVL